MLPVVGYLYLVVLIQTGGFFLHLPREVLGTWVVRGRSNLPPFCYSINALNHSFALGKAMIARTTMQTAMR